MKPPKTFSEGRTLMRPPHKTCECGESFTFGVGYEKHLREVHGWLTVYRPVAHATVLIPILSHPAHRKAAQHA